MKTVRYTDFELEGMVNKRINLISKLFLRKVSSRKELCQELGISLPTATNYTQDLLNSGFLVSESISTPGSKRPTQFLRISADAGCCAFYSLMSSGVASEFLRLDGTVLKSDFFPASGTQDSVMSALRQGMNSFPGVDCVLGVDGLVCPAKKTIFTLAGVPDWEACTPDAILTGIPAVLCGVVSRITAQTRGFSHLLGRDDSIGFFSLAGGEFRIGAIVSGQQTLGHLGTPGAAVHATVFGGSPCYCGRPRCFCAALKRGSCTSDFLAEGIRMVAEQSEILHLGIDFGEMSGLGKAVSDRLSGLSTIADGESLNREGMRIIAAEASLHHLLTDSLRFI